MGVPPLRLVSLVRDVLNITHIDREARDFARSRRRAPPSPQRRRKDRASLGRREASKIGEDRFLVNVPTQGGRMGLLLAPVDRRRHAHARAA